MWNIEVGEDQMTMETIVSIHRLQAALHNSEAFTLILFQLVDLTLKLS